MLRLTGYLSLLVLILLSFSAQSAPSQPLNEGWEYRWGDSPFQQGTPLWTTQEASDAWRSIDFPSNPPDRQGQQNAWYRITLPDGQFHDPVLYIYSIDLIAEAYLEDTLIYRFGEFDSEGKGDFLGWPWHMITLPDNYADQTLYFRVYSDYTDIGLWGEVKITERSDLLVFILSKSYANLAIAAFCLFIALLALAFGLIQREQRQFLYLSLFSLAACGKLLGETQAIQLLLDAPFLRTYITALSYYSMPIWIALLLREWLPSSKSRWMEGIAFFHTAYLLIALSSAALGWVHLSITYPVFDGLFTLSLIILLGTVAREFTRMELTQRGVIVAFSAFAFLLLIDMAVAHGFLPWTRVPISIGALLFAATLVIIFLRDFALTQRMVRQLNTDLERRVTERTHKLQSYVEQEQRYSEALQQIHVFDRRLEKLIRELQNIRSVQDQQEYLLMHLASVIIPFQLGVVRSTAPQDLQHPPQRSSHIQQYIIFIKDLQQHSQPCLTLELDTQSQSKQSTEHLLDDFMQRMADSLSFTLSSQLMYESLERMSYEDFLTGLKNRRFFDQEFARAVALAERHQHPLAMLMCDIDHFKKFNDTYGHSSGDIALQEVARVLQEHFRETDIPCRYGGEEFVLIMPRTDLKAAIERGDALRARIEHLEVNVKGQILTGLTLSIGIAVWPITTSAPQNLINAADRALYCAKHLGRNRIEIAKDSTDKSAM